MIVIAKTTLRNSNEKKVATMIEETQLMCSEILFELLKSNKIEIKWRKYSMGITAPNLKNDLLRINPLIKEKEFLTFLFSMLDKARSIALGETLEVEENQQNLINQLFQRFPTMKEEVWIRCRSNLNLLESVDYEILTKRNDKNLYEVVSHSVLLVVTAGEAQRGNEPVKKSLTMELTRQEVEHLIVLLKKSLDEIHICTKE